MRMKAFLIILAGAVVLLAAGCAQPSPRGGSSDPGFAGDTEAQGSGHDSSEPQDYRQILSDPGPF